MSVNWDQFGSRSALMAEFWIQFDNALDAQPGRILGQERVFSGRRKELQAHPERSVTEVSTA